MASERLRVVERRCLDGRAIETSEHTVAIAPDVTHLVADTRLVDASADVRLERDAAGGFVLVYVVSEATDAVTSAPADR